MTSDLATRIRAGERAALARGITLVELRRADHARAAKALLQDLMPDTGRAQRVGITGVPGAGKSTTIETLGLMLTGRGHKVAVLAVDPSSSRTGGSILGDKTRMQQLSVDPDAYIRPSPAGRALGGVARKTREAMLLCEAAGFDVIIVETVGVGQSETMVAEMVDFFLALLIPAGGDELQGIKKGLIELADAIVINKADIDPMLAKRSAQHYRAALHILEPVSRNWTPPVLTASALSGEGVAEMWGQVERHREVLTATGERAQRRATQNVGWMWSQIGDRLQTAFRGHALVASLVPELETKVRNGLLPPGAAAERLLEAFGLTDLA